MLLNVLNILSTFEIIWNRCMTHKHLHFAKIPLTLKFENERVTISCCNFKALRGGSKSDNVPIGKSGVTV